MEKKWQKSFWNNIDKEKIIPNYKEIERWRKKYVEKDKTKLASKKTILLVSFGLSIILYFMWFEMKWFSSDTWILFLVIFFVNVLLVTMTLFGKNPEELTPLEIQKAINAEKKFKRFMGIKK